MLKERNIEVDILRGIAAVLMVLGHSFITYPINIENIPWCSAISHFIYTFHMELFFILMGYVYHCCNYKKYIKNKFEHIALPYLIFGLVAMLLRAYGGALINGIEPIEEGIIKLFFRGGGYWFLYVSFIIFAIFPFMDYLLNKSIKLEIAFCCIILVFSQYIESANIEFTNFLLLDRVIHYLPYFISGHIIVRWGGIYSKTSLAMVAFIVYIIIDILEPLDNEKVRAIYRFIRAISMCYIFYCLSKTFFDKCRYKKICIAMKDFLIECSRYSLQIYLFNGYLLTTIRIVLCNFLKVKNPFLIVMTIWTCDLAISLIVCKHILSKIPLAAKLCGITRK